MPEASVDLQQAKTRTALRTKFPSVVPAGTTPTLAEQRLISLAEKIAEQRRAQETGTVRQEVLSDSESKQKIHAIFSGEKKTQTGLLIDTRLRVFERSSVTNDSMVRRFVSEGYDLLPQTDKDTIIRYLSNGLDRLPGLTSFPQKGTPERTAAIEAWLKDDANKEYYAKLLSEESAVVARENGSKEEVDSAKTEITEAETEKTEIVTKIGELQNLVEQVDTGITAFDTDPHKAGEITTLTDQIDASQVAFDTLTGQIELANTRLKILSQDKLTVSGSKMKSGDKLNRINDIETEERRLTTLLMNATEHQAIAKTAMKRYITKLAPLQAERDNLQQKRDGAEAQWQDLLVQFRENGFRLDRAYNEMYTATGGPEAIPDKILSSIETAFVGLIEERMRGDESIVNEELKQIEDNAKDEPTRQLAAGLRKRFFKPVRERGLHGIVRGHESVGLDKKEVGKAWGEFLTTGTTELVRQALVDGGMPAAEITAKLADPKFMEEATPQAISQLIAFRTRTGSKISEDEAGYIAGFKELETVFERAKTENKTVKDLVDNLSSQELIEGKTLSAIRRADKATILKIILAIFGTAALGAGVLGIGGLAAMTAGGAGLGGSLGISR